MTAAAIELRRYLADQAASSALAARLAGALRGGELLALDGPLGAGKTSFVRGVATGLGIDAALVASPTFVLAREYLGRLRLMHLDAYRLHDAAELWDVGWEEFRADPRCVVALEWSQRVPALLDEAAIRIELSYADADRGRWVLLRLPAARADLVSLLRMQE